MDLLCCETTSAAGCTAYPDPALLADDRMLLNLLRSEERYAPSASYFGCVQRDISPLMRKVVADWMLEVSPPAVRAPPTCCAATCATAAENTRRPLPGSTCARAALPRTGL